MIQTKKKTKVFMGVGLLLAAVLMGGLAYYVFHERDVLVDYVPERDRTEILKIFHDDWYWLFPGPPCRYYDPEFVLDNRSPGIDLSQYHGKLQIKVLRKDNQVAGFTTYYKKNFYEGQIQFVAVAPKFRRRGYGRLLTEYGINKLFNEGVGKIELWTRKINPARFIYEKFGFKMIGEEPEEDGLRHYNLFKKDFKPSS